MAMVSTDSAKVGMIIVEDVLNQQGNILLRKGTALTENLIETLQSLEIPGIRVEGDKNSTENGNNSPDMISSALSTEIEKLINKFSDVQNNPIMDEIFTAAKEHITEKGGQ